MNQRMREKMGLAKLSENMMKDVKAAGYWTYRDATHNCGCGCYYAGSGGSSTNENFGANYDGNLHSPEQ